MVGSRDLVVDIQQAMACIALTFHPGTICFELHSRSDQPRTWFPHAGSSDSWLRRSDPKKRW